MCRSRLGSGCDCGWSLVLCSEDYARVRKKEEEASDCEGEKEQRKEKER